MVGMTATADRREARVMRPLYVLVLAVCGLALVVAASLIARDGTVGPVERAVFEAINGLPDFLRWPMWIFQLAGLVGLPLVVAAGALAFRKVRLAIAAVLAIPLKLYVEQPVLKSLIDRERPGQTESDPILRDVPASGPSFPSGHAVIAFTLATLLAPYLGRRWQVVVWSVAVMNSVARVYLGAHNPLDVVAGAGAGLAIGGLLTLVVGVPERRRRADDPDTGGHQV